MPTRWEVVAAAAFLFCAVATAEESCDYASVQGTEFEFATKPESLQQYGYQLFGETPEPAKRLPYADYVGKRGKFLGTKTSGQYGSMKFHDILLSDCKRLYFMALKEDLADEHVEMHGITFFSKPPRVWTTYVRVDAMTDAKTCQVMPKAEMPYPLFVYSGNGAVVTAGVVGADFPGKDVMFRVDKLPAIAEREDLGPANTQKLVRQIRAGGKVLLVRSNKWPDEVPDTREFSLDGLAAALDQCKADLKK
jgi:hypothetical protein